MIKVRRGMFETNSSSVHALVLNKNEKFDEHEYIWYQDSVVNGNRWKGNILIIKPSSFSWESKLLFSPEDKVSYLVTSAMLLHRFEEFKEKVSSWLREENINFKFKNEPSQLTYKNWEEYSYPEYYKKYEPNITEDEIKERLYYNLLWANDISIDHFNDNNAQEDLVNWCLESKAHLFNFLFGDSFIRLGNDNSESCPSDRYFNKRKYKIIIKGN